MPERRPSPGAGAAAPEAGQCAMTGDSGRRPLIERPPLRSLGPVLCTGRVFSSSHRLAAEGPAGGAGQGWRATFARFRWQQTSMPSRAVVCGQPSGAVRSVVLGSFIGLAPLELAAASQVRFGAQRSGLSDQGEGGALHQVLVQQPLSLAA